MASFDEGRCFIVFSHWLHYLPCNVLYHIMRVWLHLMRGDVLLSSLIGCTTCPAMYCITSWEYGFIWWGEMFYCLLSLAALPALQCTVSHHESMASFDEGRCFIVFSHWLHYLPCNVLYHIMRVWLHLMRGDVLLSSLIGCTTCPAMYCITSWEYGFIWWGEMFYCLLSLAALPVKKTENSISDKIYIIMEGLILGLHPASERLRDVVSK